MSLRPLIFVALTIVAVMNLVEAGLGVLQGCLWFGWYELVGDGLASAAASLLTGAVTAVVIKKRHQLVTHIAAPLHRDSGHSPRRVMFFAGIAVLGVHLVLSGASQLSEHLPFLSLGDLPTTFRQFLAYPSIKMAIGAVLFFLQPIVAHALAPGRED